MARPTKLDAELQDRLTTLIRAGNTVEIAVAAVGISQASFYAWMSKGSGQRRGQLRDFYEAVERARAEAEVMLVARIATAARNGSWGAAAFLLERRYPERWERVAHRDREMLPVAPAPEVTDDPFSEVDELAERRKQHT